MCHFVSGVCLRVCVWCVVCEVSMVFCYDVSNVDVTGLWVLKGWHLIVQSCSVSLTENLVIILDSSFLI